jgi:hypothetical protein
MASLCVSESVPQRLKPRRQRAFAARLKPCPSYKASESLDHHRPAFAYIGRLLESVP